MTKKIINIWEGTYPLIIYTFVVSFVFGILMNYTPMDKLGSLAVEAVAKLICIFCMLYFYHKAPRRQARAKHKVKDGILILVTAVCFSVAFNNIISLTPLKAWSGSYTEVENMIYSASLFWQILSAGILAPILEEIVFRGILFGNYRAAIGTWPAIIASSVIFGLMHYNLVQFVYALILGVYFAYLLEKTGEIWTCMLGHIVANLSGVVLTNLGITNWMFSDVTICLISGIATLVTGVVIMVKWKKV